MDEDQQVLAIVLASVFKAASIASGSIASAKGCCDAAEEMVSEFHKRGWKMPK